MSFITANQLVKVYHSRRLEVQALRGLSLGVREGEFVAIIGPSGSGKTTLLNIFGGLDTPTAGAAVVAGVSLATLSDAGLLRFRRTVVGHIFQSLNLIPSLTAFENIELPLIAAGAPRSSRRARCQELLEIMNLQDRAAHKPGELSGGEQQRVAIAAALANDPPLILADEPTGELDTQTAQQIVEYLGRINKELGKTILMVTHDPLVARQTGRILRIEDGVIRGEFQPTQGETESASYSVLLRERLAGLDREIAQLDVRFKQDQVAGDEFMSQRKRLMNAKVALEDELHRLGA